MLRITALLGTSDVSVYFYTISQFGLVLTFSLTPAETSRMFPAPGY